MARQWRIKYEGALYHVLSRGNEKRNIFLDEEDRLFFLKTLGRMSDRFDTEIYAYVLMDNHLLLRTRKANLSRALPWFGVVYTSRVNLRHNRSGHLFQGRFKSLLIEKENYLVQLSCYIHRNPLRSGLTQRLGGYRWSSYLAYAYGKNVPEWLRRTLIYSFFPGEDPGGAYRHYIQRYAGEESRVSEDLRHGLFIGSEEFGKGLEKSFLHKGPHPEIPQQKRIQRKNLRDIIEKGSSILQCRFDDFLSVRRLRGVKKENRDLLIYAFWASGHYKNDEISRLFGISYSAVSHCVRQMVLNLAQDGYLERRWQQFHSQFKM